MEIKKINIIGFGNVGQSLYAHLNKLLVVESIFTRNITEDLIQLFDGKITDKIENISQNVDLNIIVVSDSAIPSILLSIPKDIPVVHSSGGTDINVFTGFNNYGILYPLQTFTKNAKIDLRTVPFFIEGNTNEFEAKIKEFTSVFLSSNVFKANSEQRKHLHLSAVITNNFFTYFLSVAEEILQNKDIPLAVLSPLLEETLRKAMTFGAKESITGPAVRGDFKLLEKYSEMIKNENFNKIFNQINSEISRKSFNVL